MPNATSHIWLKRTERLCADIASPANHDAEKPNHERHWPVGFESLAQCEKTQPQIRHGACGLQTLPGKWDAETEECLILESRLTVQRFLADFRLRIRGLEVFGKKATVDARCMSFIVRKTLGARTWQWRRPSVCVTIQINQAWVRRWGAHGERYRSEKSSVGVEDGPDLNRCLR